MAKNPRLAAAAAAVEAEIETVKVRVISTIKYLTDFVRPGQFAELPVKVAAELEDRGLVRRLTPATTGDGAPTPTPAPGITVDGAILGVTKAAQPALSTEPDGAETE